jgi:hypothetical protein
MGEAQTCGQDAGGREAGPDGQAGNAFAAFVDETQWARMVWGESTVIDGARVAASFALTNQGTSDGIPPGEPKGGYYVRAGFFVWRS